MGFLWNDVVDVNICEHFQTLIVLWRWLRVSLVRCLPSCGFHVLVLVLKSLFVYKNVTKTTTIFHCRSRSRREILTSQLRRVIRRDIRSCDRSIIVDFKKFYGRHKILVDRYKVSVTHIISDLFLEALYRSWLTCYYGGLLCMFECILIYPFLQWVIYKFRWWRPFLQWHV